MRIRSVHSYKSLKDFEKDTDRYYFKVDRLFTHYVYVHNYGSGDKVDTPFYVGIGTLSGGFKRAKDKTKRSEAWQKIVDKYDYSIDIICICATQEDAENLEEFLINDYEKKGFSQTNKSKNKFDK